MPMLHFEMPAGKAAMTVRGVASAVLLTIGVGLTSLHGAAVSRQQADAFARKVDAIERHGAVKDPRRDAAARRTPVSESEINSWFAYDGKPALPEGITQPTLSIVGNGQVAGRAIVDLDAVSRSRASGRTFDIWNLVGGRVPVTIAGVVRTRGGRARFELQDASIRGIPVPRMMVEELVSYYSRTPAHPRGRRLDDEFVLPAAIDRIEIGAGSAVVVQ